MADTIIIRTSEICLKGNNRSMFEKRLLGNVRERLIGLAEFKLRRSQGGILAEAAAKLSADTKQEAVQRLSRIFGVAHLSCATACEPELAALSRTATILLADSQGTFKVETSRADKSFRLTSPEISREVGGAILGARPDLRVDVKRPEHLVHIDIEKGVAFVSAGRAEGPGGLPIGSSGRLVALLSGGIDSPVAAWKTMRRGCRTALVHCHSYPYVGDASVGKVKRLASILAEWQGPTELLLIPIGDLQREIAAKTDQSLRVILYRRAMLRLAARAAGETGALGLVTGDSIGQVASQTLENLATVSAAVSLPIYRPLVGEDKNAIIAAAKSIGTYAISVEPHDDCCSLFLPDHPATRSLPEKAAAAESRFDAAGLADRAWSAAERLRIEPPWSVERPRR